MSELLKKYESLDQSKLNEATIKILNRVKSITADFTTDDEKNNKIAEQVLNEVMKKNPDAVKIVKRTPKAKPAPKKTHKATHTKKTTQPASSTPKNSNNIMSVAKEIQKTGESWKDAMERAKEVLKQRKEQVVEKQKTELEKLYNLVKTRKELQGFANSDIRRDAVRTAKVKGARIVTKEGTTSNGYGTFDNKLGRKYWETRDKHADRLAPNYPKDMPFLADGGMTNLTTQNLSFADGGQIEGSKIWDLLSKEQKGNFITKYKPEIEKNLKLTRDIIFNSTKSDNWNSLNKNIKNVFNKHIENKKFYFENIGKKVTWEDYKGEKRKGEIDGIDFNGDYIIIEPDELYGGDTLSPDEVNIKEESKKKFWLFADGGGVGQKKYNTQFNVGKAKYVVNYHDGVKKHKDGSNFYDIEILKNKKDFEAFLTKLSKEGYKEMRYNTPYEKGGIFYKEGSNKYGLGNTEIFVQEENDMYCVYDNLYNDESENWEIKKLADFDTMDEAKEFAIEHSKKEYANGGSLPFMTDPNFGNFQNTGAFEDGGSIGDLTEQEFLKKYFGTNVFTENPSQYFEIKKLSSSDDNKVDAFVKELKADGFTVKKRAYSDFTSVMGVKKKESFADGGSLITETVSAVFNPNEKDGKIKTTFGDKTKAGLFEMMTTNNYDPQEITSAIFIPNAKKGRIYTEWGAKTKEGLYEMIYNMRNTFELGGAFMMTDLAGHTGGSDGLGNQTPLSGVSGTYYTGLVGETGAMSSGELFMNGGAMAQNQKVINDASQSYVNYYLGEGASQGIYKDGGSIDNQYEGRTPEDIWKNLSRPQRSHFLYDHIVEIEEYKNIERLPSSEIIKAYNSEWFYLDKDIKNRFSNHVREGQYASGGSLGKSLYVAYSSYFDSNKYDEEKIMSALKSIGAKNIHLENDGGMSNQPEVVVFNGSKRQAEDALNEAFDTDYILIYEKDWRTKKMANGGDVLPPSKTYGENLEKAMMKFNISNSEARKKYGLYTISQWDDLLSEKMADGGGIRSQEELNKIISEKDEKVKGLTPKQVAEMWNENSFGVKEGISKPITVEEAKSPIMKMYLRNLLIENELTEDEYSEYFSKGGEIEIQSIKVGDWLQKKDNKAKAKVIKVEKDKYSTELYIEDIYGNKVSRPLDFIRIDEWKIINEPKKELERIKKVLAEQEYADGGFMNNVYGKGGEIKDIQKMKKALIAKAKSKGIYENFGQKEVRDLEDKYGYTNSVREFDNWAMNFDLSKMSDGGSLMEVHDGTAFMNNPIYAERGAKFDDNDGFMKADNNRNFRYPEKEVFIETFDEPIDLTNNVSTKSNEVVITPINEEIDLNDDKKVRATMTYYPENRTPEKMMMVNQRMVFTDMPMPTSNTHKND